MYSSRIPSPPRGLFAALEKAMPSIIGLVGGNIVVSCQSLLLVLRLLLFLKLYLVIGNACTMVSHFCGSTYVLMAG